MAYGSAPSAAAQSPPRGARSARATAALVLLVASGLLGGALLLLGGAASNPEPPTNKQGEGTVIETERYAKQAQKWGQQLGEFADFSKQWKSTTKPVQSTGVGLHDVEKTDQSVCLNKKLAELTAAVSVASDSNRATIGSTFADEQTGKDDYANARNKVALKDGSYLPVASATAEMKVLSGFMQATEVVEADAWATALEEGGDVPSDTVENTITLLTPTLSAVASAKAFIEEVKVDFSDLVMHCFIEDCPPGKGLYRTDGGPKCTSCTAGETWSGATDAEPCAAVLPSCESGEGYSPSTSTSADAVCVNCAGGTFSPTNDANACTAFAVVGCPAGEELTPGTADSDGSCTACADGKFKSGASTARKCTPFTAVTCGAGQESAPGTATANTQCAACPSGTFSVGGGSACGPHGSTNCGPGFQHVSGSASSDHSCEACAAGRFKAGSSASSCTAIGVNTCPAGKQLTAGSSIADGTCSNCPPGTEKTVAGPGACVTVPRVSFQVGHGLCMSLGTRVYNGDGDNPGSAAQRIDRCSAACFNEKPALGYGPWSSRPTATGFALTMNNGRCYCNLADFGTCRKAHTSYVAYQYQRPAPPSTRVGGGLCMPLGVRVYDGNGDSPGSPQQQKDRCAAACFNEKAPKDPRRTSWSRRPTAKGFALSPSGGRCYCQHENFRTCRKAHYGYVAYEF